MTDYLALAMEQGENISSAEEESSLSVGAAKGIFGGFFGGKESPQTPEETPEGGFRFPPSGLPLKTTKGQGLQPLPFGNPPGDAIPKQGAALGLLHNAQSGRRDPSDVQPDVAETGEGGPAADPEWLHTAGVSRSAAVYDALLSGSGSGADGAILTSLISRRQEGQKGFLGGSGGPFFGLSKNGPPGGDTSTIGWSEWQNRDWAVLPLLRQVRQAQRSSGFVQSQRRAFTVTLPESGSTAALSAEDFDLACERDARRYGGGFGLY